jgi:hypothetical protein
MTAGCDSNNYINQNTPCSPYVSIGALGHDWGFRMRGLMLVGVRPGYFGPGSGVRRWIGPGWHARGDADSSLGVGLTTRWLNGRAMLVQSSAARMRGTLFVVERQQKKCHFRYIMQAWCVRPWPDLTPGLCGLTRATVGRGAGLERLP